jgi:myo-inositol-1(or 4)-monophosphatase
MSNGLSAEPAADRILEVALTAARRAGRVLRARLGRLRRVETKGENDLVTEADRRAEGIIAAEIRAVFPDHSLLAEEGTSGGGAAEHLWVVDPLDGTTNYVHTYPLFAVSIAYVYRERPLVGVVYAPLLGETFWAVAGKGAWLNGRRIRVSAVASLKQALVAAGLPSASEKRRDVVATVEELIGQVQDFRSSGSAVLDLCFVAAGRLDAYFEHKLSPWDVAAGGLIVLEAGGQVTDLAGNPFRPTQSSALATNGHLHAELLQRLRPASTD